MVDLRCGDCLDVLATLEPDSLDACVTDPPYHLTSIVKRFGKPGSAPAQFGTDGAYARASAGFMGKQWDGGDIAFRPETWAAVLRVLKPGAHLIAFGGTRTYHRLACAVEDAGFEIRDMISWVYSSGFPKSHNMDNLRGETFCGCKNPEPAPKREVHFVSGADVSAPMDTRQRRGKVLQPSVPQQGASVAGREKSPASEDGGGEPRVERRSDVSPTAWELPDGEVCSSPGMGDRDGQDGRVHNGTPPNHGGEDWAPAEPQRDGSPHRPQPAKQRSGKPRTAPGQSHPQALGAWPTCRRCGKPIIPHGLGTALKPALEPVVFARKPLIGTVAQNVAAHRTGALNIDGCRVECDGGSPSQMRRQSPASESMGWRGENPAKDFGKVAESWARERAGEALGRWPANLIHDGSDEVLAAFPAQAGAQAPVRGNEPSDKTDNTFGAFAGRAPSDRRDGGGSAARFFYCAKASRSDRNDGCDELPDRGGGMRSETSGQHITRRDGSAPGPTKNNHPTVKPTDLMRYLCRLVTPPGGTVLDPFMGSGSTGRGAALEGFGFVGIEREAEYFAIAKARIAAATPVTVPEVAPQLDLFGAA